MKFKTPFSDIGIIGELLLYFHNINGTDCEEDTAVHNPT
jgi:hypothetical protein